MKTQIDRNNQKWVRGAAVAQETLNLLVVGSNPTGLIFFNTDIARFSDLAYFLKNFKNLLVSHSRDSK